MRGQYFSILNSSLRCLSRGVAVQNTTHVFQCNQTRSVLLCDKFATPSFSFHTSSSTFSKDDSVDNETPAKTEEVNKVEATPVKSAAVKNEKLKEQEIAQTSAPETLVKNEKSKEQEITQTSASETLVKENDATENSKKLEIKLTTAKKVKKRRKKKKKAEKKQKTSETPPPETLVKKVSQEMYPEAVKEQENVEFDLLKQLLVVEGKAEKTTTTQSLFETPKRKSTSRNFQQNKSSQNRLHLFNITKETIEAAKEMKRPQDTSLWTATDWFNSMQDEIDQFAYDSPYPANSYQEQIMWTEEGKLWTFPINNEQGVDEEEKATPFYKHVFLESHLKDWCPRTGAIREFMTSLVTALSMNPHLTVREKHEHLDWFRSYFEEKSKMMQQLGLVEQHHQQQAASSK